MTQWDPPRAAYPVYAGRVDSTWYLYSDAATPAVSTLMTIGSQSWITTDAWPTTLTV